MSALMALKAEVERALDEAILSLGEKTKLRDACEYGLKSGGKRMRPLIVMLVAQGLGNGLEAREAALAAEFFHTSSLIADDLPCMDNDDERRNRPTLHKAFGETVAVLASYALITAGFEFLTKNGETMRRAPGPFGGRADGVCAFAVREAARLAGIQGATGGQFYDLFPQGGGTEELKRTFYLKTVTLFEMSFLCGWLFGGGERERVPEVKEVAYHFGMAFQIADDLGDLAKDAGKEEIANVGLLLGEKKAVQLLERELAAFELGARVLGIWTPALEELVSCVNP